MLIFQGIFTYLPAMNSMFHSTPIGLASWSRILAVSLLAYGVVKGEKWLRRLQRWKALLHVPIIYIYGSCTRV
jgi:hypothetical protein